MVKTETARKPAKAYGGAPPGSADQILEIHPSQLHLLKEAKAKAEAAEAHLNTLATGIVAGHGIIGGSVIDWAEGKAGEAPTLTVRLPAAAKAGA